MFHLKICNLSLKEEPKVSAFLVMSVKKVEDKAQQGGFAVLGAKEIQRGHRESTGKIWSQIMKLGKCIKVDLNNWKYHLIFKRFINLGSNAM